MTKRFWTSLILCIMVFSGCITDSGSDDNNSSDGSNTLASRYLPLKTGTTYTYKKTLQGEFDDWELEWCDEDSVTYDISIDVGARTSKNRKTYYTLANRRPRFQYTTGQIVGTYTDTTYCRLADDILYTFEMTDVFETYEADDSDEYYNWLEIEIPLIDFNSNSWIIHSNSYIGDGNYYSILWTGSYLGQQSVTVPAGTFEDCAVFNLIHCKEGYYTSYSYYNGEERESYTDITTTKVWYAPGVGMVKKIVIEDNIEEYDETRTVTTTELKSYNIP